jgi:hypothetical protein
MDDNFLTISMVVAAFGAIYYLFGVPRVSSKLNLYYKKDSEIVSKILTNTDLGSLTFKTCIAGTVNTIQMITMLVVELVYHKLYKQVKFHREIFKFKDGG